jgi:hypothetical protein
LDPPAHCVLYSLRGQTLAEALVEALVELLVELRTEVHAELLQSFGRAPCTSPPEIRSAEVSQAPRLYAAAEFAIATPPRRQVAHGCKVDALNACKVLYKLIERYLRYL